MRRSPPLAPSPIAMRSARSAVSPSSAAPRTPRPPRRRAPTSLPRWPTRSSTAAIIASVVSIHTGSVTAVRSHPPRARGRREPASAARRPSARSGLERRQRLLERPGRQGAARAIREASAAGAVATWEPIEASSPGLTGSATSIGLDAGVRPAAPRGGRVLGLGAAMRSPAVLQPFGRRRRSSGRLLAGDDPRPRRRLDRRSAQALEAPRRPPPPLARGRSAPRRWRAGSA